MRHWARIELTELEEADLELSELLLEQNQNPWTRYGLLVYEVSQLVPAVLDLPREPWAAQLLAELVNWLAKSQDEAWYAVKPAAWALARELGCAGGWSSDDGGHEVYNLYTPEAGVSCAHDPTGRLEELVPREVWTHGWSGIRRQDQAERLIRDPVFRRRMAWATQPVPVPTAWRWMQAHSS